MKRFLLVEVETDCGGVCRPTRFSYDYECGPGPAVTSLRVLDGTKAYPLHLDDVVDEAERRHRRLLASHEPELRALVSTNGNDVREETTLCVAPADPNLHVGVRTIARVQVDCRGRTDCAMGLPFIEPSATLSSDFTVSREGRVLREETGGPVRTP